MKALTRSEGHDTCPKISRMERDVNTGQRNSGETSFELDVTLGLLLGLRTIETLSDYITQHLLHLLNAERFCQLGKVSIWSP